MLFSNDAFMLAMDSSTVIGTGIPLASRGPNKLLISWPLSYGESVLYGQTAPCISGAYNPGRSQSLHGDFPHGNHRCASVTQWRNQSLLHRKRTVTDAAITQSKTRLLQEIFFLPYRQLILLRQLDRRRRADFFTAATENTATEVELPRQLIGDQICFYCQRVRWARIDTGRTANTLLRIMFRLTAEVLSTAIGSSG